MNLLKNFINNVINKKIDTILSKKLDSITSKINNTFDEYNIKISNLNAFQFSEARKTEDANNKSTMLAYSTLMTTALTVIVTGLYALIFTSSIFLIQVLLLLGIIFLSYFICIIFSYSTSFIFYELKNGSKHLKIGSQNNWHDFIINKFPLILFYIFLLFNILLLLNGFIF